MSRYITKKIKCEEHGYKCGKVELVTTKEKHTFIRSKDFPSACRVCERMESAHEKQCKCAAHFLCKEMNCKTCPNLKKPKPDLQLKSNSVSKSEPMKSVEEIKIILKKDMYFVESYGDQGEFKIRADKLWTKVSELKELFSSEMMEVKKDTAEDICIMIDDIELRDQGNTLEAWKQYKHIRNAIRDKYVLRLKQKVGEV